MPQLDAAQVEAVKARFAELTADGKFSKEAAKTAIRQEMKEGRFATQAPEQPAAQTRVAPGFRGPRQYDPAATARELSVANSASRGAGEGLTLGWSSELSAVPSAALSYVPGLVPGTEDMSLIDRYRMARDVGEEANKIAHDENPKVYRVSEFGGGALGAAAGGAVAGGAKMLAKQTIGRSVKTGGKMGFAYGLGGSDADLTKGEVGEALVDAGIGTAGGMAGGALGHGITKAFEAGAGAAASKFSRGAAAERVGKEFGETLDDASVFDGRTMREAADVGAGVEKAVTDATGEKFQLEPSQLLGSSWAARMESAARQFGRAANRMMVRKMNQLRVAEKFIQSKAEAIAADPALLGRADVSRHVSTAIEGRREIIGNELAEIGKEMFGAASTIGAGRPIMGTDNFREMAGQLVKEYSGYGIPTEPIIAKINQSMAGLVKDGKLTVDEFQNLMSYWGKKAASKGKPFEELDIQSGQKFAKAMFKALYDDLDAMAAGSASRGGDAAKALIRAKDAYKAKIGELEEMATDTVRSILGMADGDAFDTMTTKLVGASEEQIKGVFSVLNKADPAAAQQLQAQLFEDVFTKSKAMLQRGTITEGRGMSEMLKPGQALKAFLDAKPMLEAAFEGNSKARVVLAETHELLRRLNIGPGYEGSQTAPALVNAASGAVDSVLQAAERSGGLASGMAAKFVRRALTNDKMMSEVWSSDLGRDALLASLRMLVRGKEPSKAALRAIAAGSALLGADAAKKATGNQ